MTVQVALKLPDNVVEAIDALVSEGAFKSRSEAIRSGAEAVIAQRRRQDVAQYRDAFAEYPETDGEVADATRLALEAIHDEPWERWW
jgi:Arc/MetJ-type ribon-helix-helix transcriptional regulator